MVDTEKAIRQMRTIIDRFHLDIERTAQFREGLLKLIQDMGYAPVMLEIDMHEGGEGFPSLSVTIELYQMTDHTPKVNGK